jgi:hypothetical protein
MMSLRLIGLFFAIVLIASPVAAAGDNAPAWLQQAAALKVPPYDVKDVPAVILQNEQQVTVSPDGRVTTVTTFALRVIIHEGRDYAYATQSYQTDGGKVREMHG